MKTAARILALLAIWTLAGWVSIAQTAPAPPAKSAPTSKAPPAITDALKLRFFKAQSEFIQASDAVKAATQNAQQKQVLMQEVITEIGKVCGDGFVPDMNPAGDPSCAAKPSAPEPKK